MGYETKVIQKQTLFNILAIKKKHRSLKDYELELRASMDESDIEMVEKKAAELDELEQDERI